MKTKQINLITILGILIIFNFNLKSQNILLTYDSKPVKADSAITVYVDVNSFYKAHIYVTNQTEQDMNIRIIKKEISVVSGSDNTFCWAGTCYSPQTLYSDYMLIETGITNKDFYSEYNPNGNPGKTTLTFKFSASSGDTALVTINFIGTTNSVNEQNTHKTFFKAYPSPCFNKLNFSYNLPSGYKNYNCVITNLSGIKCNEFEINPYINNLSIETNGLKPGLYNYLIQSESKILFTGKIVIFK